MSVSPGSVLALAVFAGVKAAAEDLKSKGLDIGTVADGAVENGAGHTFGFEAIGQNVTEKAPAVGRVAIDDQHIIWGGHMDDGVVDGAVLARGDADGARATGDAEAGDQGFDRRGEGRPAGLGL